MGKENRLDFDSANRLVGHMVKSFFRGMHTGRARLISVINTKTALIQPAGHRKTEKVPIDQLAAWDAGNLYMQDHTHTTATTPGAVLIPEIILMKSQYQARKVTRSKLQKLIDENKCPIVRYIRIDTAYEYQKGTAIILKEDGFFITEESHKIPYEYAFYFQEDQLEGAMMSTTPESIKPSGRFWYVSTSNGKYWCGPRIGFDSDVTLTQKFIQEGRAKALISRLTHKPKKYVKQINGSTFILNNAALNNDSKPKTTRIKLGCVANQGIDPPKLRPTINPVPPINPIPPIPPTSAPTPTPTPITTQVAIDKQALITKYHKAIDEEVAAYDMYLDQIKLRKRAEAELLKNQLITSNVP